MRRLPCWIVQEFKHRRFYMHSLHCWKILHRASIRLHQLCIREVLCCNWSDSSEHLFLVHCRIIQQLRSVSLHALCSWAGLCSHCSHIMYRMYSWILYNISWVHCMHTLPCWISDSGIICLRSMQSVSSRGLLHIPGK